MLRQFKEFRGDPPAYAMTTRVDHGPRAFGGLAVPDGNTDVLRPPLQSAKAVDQRDFFTQNLVARSEKAGRPLSHNRCLNQEISSLLCIQCEKILYKLQKIFTQMQNVRKESDAEDLITTSAKILDEQTESSGTKIQRQNPENIDASEFKWRMTGNTAQDQLSILEQLDKFAKQFESYENKKAENQ